MKPTVNSIFRDHADEFLDTYKVSYHTLKVIRAITNCRTEVLGGHVRQCDSCGEKIIQYNSCRNRHCPTKFLINQILYSLRFSKTSFSKL